MVVPVLMISCHVSDYWNIGPVIAQAAMIHTATTNVTGCPAAVEVLVANQLKKRRMTCRNAHATS